MSSWLTPTGQPRLRAHLQAQTPEGHWVLVQIVATDNAGMCVLEDDRGGRTPWLNLDDLTVREP